MDFFYYYPFTAQVKKPLIISILLHLIIMLAAFNADDIEINNTINVILENNIPQKAAIKKIDKFIPITDETVQNTKKDIKKGNKIDPSSLFQSQSQKQTKSDKTMSNSFNDEFEKILFSKKKTADTRENEFRKSVSANQNLNWKEDSKVEFDPKAKESREETVKIPGGEATSKSIKWKEGYARKIIFQPDIAYPLYFRKQGIQGSVIIQIRVDAGGNVVSAEITKSSGYSKLDILGRNGIVKARFSKKDNLNGAADIADVEIQFKLER